MKLFSSRTHLDSFKSFVFQVTQTIECRISRKTTDNPSNHTNKNKLSSTVTKKLMRETYVKHATSIHGTTCMFLCYL